MSRGLSIFQPQRFRDHCGDEMADVAAEAGNFFHQPRRDVAVFFFGHEKERFKAGRKSAIHQCHLKFKFKITDGTDAADDCASILLLRKLDEQSVECGDAHISYPGNHGVEQRDAFFGREESLLFGVEGDGDDDLFAQLGCTFDHVEMTVGDGIKRASVDCAFHTACVAERFRKGKGKAANRAENNPVTTL